MLILINCLSGIAQNDRKVLPGQAGGIYQLVLSKSGRGLISVGLDKGYKKSVVLWI